MLNNEKSKVIGIICFLMVVVLVRDTSLVYARDFNLGYDNSGC